MSMNEPSETFTESVYLCSMIQPTNKFVGWIDGLATRTKGPGLPVYLLPLAFSITSFATFVGAATKCENSMVELARPEVMVRN